MNYEPYAVGFVIGVAFGILAKCVIDNCFNMKRKKAKKTRYDSNYWWNNGQKPDLS